MYTIPILENQKTYYIISVERKLSMLIFFEENNNNMAGSAANPHLRNKKITDIIKAEVNDKTQ